MHRFTTLATTAAAAAVAVSGFVLPANAEAVVYETHDLRSNVPGGGHEYASIDIPTGYAKDRIDWHTIAFFEQVDQGRTIIVDLQPEADTVRELKADRAELQGEESYEEFAFNVNDKDAKVRALWSFTYSEPSTGDVEPLISVLLMSGNQIKIIGKVEDRKHLRFIREHVRKSVAFPS